MAALESLLVVQEHDSAADRLRHRRATLPQRAELVAFESEASQLDAQLTDVRERRGEVLAQEKRLDDEATSLEAKAKEVERKLYGGTVSNPKELSAMQADVEMLRARRDDLEELELEVMEQREALDLEVADLEAAAAEAWSQIARLGEEIAAAEAEIDAELASEASQRAAAAASVSPDLLAQYETIRTKNKGVGIARLVGVTCQSCRLSLPATDVDRIRRLPEDALSRCDNCGAILVP